MTTNNCSDCCIITPENHSKPGFIPGFGGLLLPSHSIVPDSGQLTLAGLGREKVNDDYDSTDSISNVSLGGLAESDGYDNTNPYTPIEPDTSTPHAMSEWYGYDHDFENPNTTVHWASDFVSTQFLQSDGTWGTGWSCSNLGHTWKVDWSSNNNHRSHTISNVRFYIANFPWGYGSLFPNGVSLTITINQWGSVWSSIGGQGSQWVESFSRTITPGDYLDDPQTTSYNETKHVSLNYGQTNDGWGAGMGFQDAYSSNGSIIWNSPPNTGYFHNSSSAPLVRTGLVQC